jgi:tetratricopeptide (TPR) repeat protein
MRILLLVIVIFSLVGQAFSAVPEIQFSQKKSRYIYTNYLKSLMFSFDGENNKSLEYMRHVEKEDPLSLVVRLKIASLFMRMGQMRDAEKELKSAKKIDTGNIDVSLAMIVLYSYMQNDKALEEEYGHFLENAHNVRPENLKIAEYLAQFYFYKNRINDAIKVYETIIVVNPKYVDGMFWLGYLYSETGRLKDAVREWKDVLRIDNNHAPTLNSLAYTYAETGVNLNEAEMMIKMSLEKEPENGAYLDTMGWIYYKEKKYKLADEYLNKALILLRDPIVYQHLGRVCADSGDPKKALEYYSEGVKYFPDDKVLQEGIKAYGTKSKTSKK